MTPDEIRAAWARFMHRGDLSADMTAVEIFAIERIVERLTFTPEWQSADDGMADAPLLFLHAGLIYLHELAQDDEGMAREISAFEDAVAGYSMRKSRERNRTVDPFTYARS